MTANTPASKNIQPKGGGKASVLKSLIHKQNPSSGTPLSAKSTDNLQTAAPNPSHIHAMPFLPNDHPHSRALSELQENQQMAAAAPSKSPNKSKRPHTTEEVTRPVHKKTFSTVNLKGLVGKETEGKARPESPKKTKSSTNISNLLSRPKSSKNLRKQAAGDGSSGGKDKENDEPSLSPHDPYGGNPPIYAQFSTEHFATQPSGGKFLEDEINLYTPQNYTPGKQRNFYEGPQTRPTLNRRKPSSQRPKSTYLPTSFSIQDLSRRVSTGSSHSTDLVRRVSDSRQPNVERKPIATGNKIEKTATTRGQRMLAALKPLNTQPNTEAATPDPLLDEAELERQFEALLDRRNIAEDQRWKMRSLATSMKKDFIRQDWSETTAAKSRPTTKHSDSSAEATEQNQDTLKVKKRRPRSRTFTLSRSSSKEPPVSKKAKPEENFEHSRKKSSESTRGGKSLTAAGAAVAQSMIAKAKGQQPDDFVAYLKKVQKPEVVEVGKLHKLRLLLRNETVAWTEEFIKQGGMEEIVGLLHRIMQVEWREEHEDTLLHEVLLCLKALSTTAMAMQHLDRTHSTLFPALLHMLFDDEKKGPSEFTTRNIVTTLLMTYLKSASIPERENKARNLLSYLRDPEPKESQRPVGFVLGMRRPRPYKVWCKEAVNVTKEVFWIFLHTLNVVPLPGTKGADAAETGNSAVAVTLTTGYDVSNPEHVYMASHFPKELPPVPAAPYVGGVEWDATNYLASHLDLINGIMACLPTKEERNALREQLQLSGWEKCMGITLRTCKEKFYGGVHAGLRCWVAAAVEDGWDTRDVRCGPSSESGSPVKSKSPKKAPASEQPAPKIDMKLELKNVVKKDDGWL